MDPQPEANSNPEPVQAGNPASETQQSWKTKLSGLATSITATSRRALERCENEASGFMEGLKKETKELVQETKALAGKLGSTVGTMLALDEKLVNSQHVELNKDFVCRDYNEDLVYQAFVASGKKDIKIEHTQSVAILSNDAALLKLYEELVVLGDVPVHAFWHAWLFWNFMDTHPDETSKDLAGAAAPQALDEDDEKKAAGLESVVNLSPIREEEQKKEADGWDEWE